VRSSVSLLLCGGGRAVAEAGIRIVASPRERGERHPRFGSGLRRVVCCGHLCNGVLGVAGLWRGCRLGACRAVVGDTVSWWFRWGVGSLRDRKIGTKRKGVAKILHYGAKACQRPESSQQRPLAALNVKKKTRFRATTRGYPTKLQQQGTRYLLPTKPGEIKRGGMMREGRAPEKPEVTLWVSTTELRERYCYCARRFYERTFWME
jgi:hypothetical protein